MISLAVSKNIVFAMLPNESPTNDPNSPGNNPPSVFPMTIPAKLSTTVNPMSWMMSRSSKLFPVKIQQLLILLSHLNEYNSSSLFYILFTILVYVISP